MSAKAWRFTAAEKLRISSHAKDHLPCPDCSAAPSEKCDRPGRGKIVHTSRYAAAAIDLRNRARPPRTPEQEAVLAALPRISREEIEAHRTESGAYSFSREWFLSNGLPYPPVHGWMEAVLSPPADDPETLQAFTDAMERDQ